MQVDPIKPTLKVPGAKRLKLKYNEPLSNFAFNFNVRLITKDPYGSMHLAAEAALDRAFGAFSFGESDEADDEDEEEEEDEFFSPTAKDAPPSNFGGSPADSKGGAP